MATLTNTKIKDTYTGLLKTDDNAVVGATGKVITDGDGNATPLTISTSEVLIDNIPITQGVEKNSTNPFVGHSIYIGKNIAQNEQLGATAANVIIGEDAGNALTPAGNMFGNTLVGYGVAKDHTGGLLSSVGIGPEAFKQDSNNPNSYDISSCIGVGDWAMANYQGTNGPINSLAIGSSALSFRNDLFNEIAIGNFAGVSYGTADNFWGPNISIGGEALIGANDVRFAIGIGANVCGFAYNLSNCIAVGGYSLDNSNTVSDSIAIGDSALSSAGSVEASVYIGHYSGSGANNVTGMVCIGNVVGNGQSNNQNCTFIGYNSGGAFNFNNNSNATALGYNATPTASNQITLGDSSITSLRCNVTTISSLSDARDKSNVEDMPLGLDFVNALRPVKFDWSRRDGSMQGVKEVGFIAQELDAVQSQFACEEYLKMVDKTDADRLEASYAQLVPVLVKAIQELKLEVESLKNA